VVAASMPHDLQDLILVPATQPLENQHPLVVPYLHQDLREPHYQEYGKMTELQPEGIPISTRQLKKPLASLNTLWGLVGSTIGKS